MFKNYLARYGLMVFFLPFQQYDACAFLPCSNDGSCSAEPLSHDYLCQCMSGFSGDNCETNIDDCVDHTCESYQYCFDGVNDYTCDCPIGLFYILI